MAAALLGLFTCRCETTCLTSGTTPLRADDKTASRYQIPTDQEGTLRHQSPDTKYPVLRSIGRALPTNYYPQEILSTALWNEWRGKIEDSARFQHLHRSVGVRGRHLALPMDEYRGLDSFAKANDKRIESPEISV